eukprot:13647271-Alexandrium_andersonii.AAC.1
MERPTQDPPDRLVGVCAICPFVLWVGHHRIEDAEEASNDMLPGFPTFRTGTPSPCKLKGT